MQRVPAPLLNVHERLMNWAAWSRDKKPQGHCRSIEYRYKSPDVWRHGEIGGRLDGLDALRVYEAVIRLPSVSRWMLQLWYVQCAPAHYIRRKLKLGREEVVQELNRSRVLLKNRLQSL